MTSIGYQQVVDRMAHYLTLMIFQNEAGVALLGTNHPILGNDIRTLDDITAVAATTYNVSEDELFDEALEIADMRLAALYLKIGFKVS